MAEILQNEQVSDDFYLMKVKRKSGCNGAVLYVTCME